MSLTYTVIVQETKPTNASPGFLWLMRSIAQIWIRLGEGFIPLISGPASLVGLINEGIYSRTVTVSTSFPGNPMPVDICFRQDTKQWFIYLDDWYTLQSGI